MFITGRVILLAELTVYKTYNFIIFSMKHVVSLLIMRCFRVLKFVVQAITRKPIIIKNYLNVSTEYKRNSFEPCDNYSITEEKIFQKCETSRACLSCKVKVKVLNTQLELPLSYTDQTKQNKK